MSVTQIRPTLTPAQARIEAIVQVASGLGMSGFALAQLRTTATEQIELAITAERERCCAKFEVAADMWMKDDPKASERVLNLTTQLRIKLES